MAQTQDDTLHEWGTSAPSCVDLQPLRWKPEYDAIVSLKLAGWQQQAIAAITGYSQGRVSIILNDPRARASLMQQMKQLRRNTLLTVEEELLSLAPRSVHNLATTIEGTFEPGSREKIHQDTVSFELLARVGFGRKETKDEDSAVKFTGEAAKQLVTALAAAREAREIREQVEESPDVQEEGQQEALNGAPNRRKDDIPEPTPNEETPPDVD